MFRRMVDMRRTAEEKEEDREEMSVGLSAPSIPDVPYGLRLCLTHDELDKLGLDADCEVGDMIHLFAMAEVTSISKNDNGNGPECRVELSITHLGCEDEDTETEPD